MTKLDYSKLEDYILNFDFLILDESSLDFRNIALMNYDVKAGFITKLILVMSDLKLAGFCKTILPEVRIVVNRDYDSSLKQLLFYMGVKEFPAVSQTDFSRTINRACATDSTVLLLGESGAGKGFAARYIHDHSRRKNNTYLYQSFANISPALFDSALFGSRTGAFTDAENINGIVYDSSDGTLFLDEIGLLPKNCQGKLFSLLDNGEFSRVGESCKHPLRSRLIFATNLNLGQMVKNKTFMLELYYRICILVITVPPLREHPDDIIPLSMKFAKEMGKGLHESALEKLHDYYWPGNIRELKNCIERACCYSEGDEVLADDITFMEL